jgi:diacylglycerol kinase family enzyme
MNLAGTPSEAQADSAGESARQLAPSAWLVIANPNAGGMRSRSFQKRWLPTIEHAVGQMVFTQSSGHAAELASTARGYAGLAALGGDGTVQQVLSGMDRDRQRLAVLPAGRGNGLARELGVGGVGEGLLALSRGFPQPIDLIEIDLVAATGQRVRTLAISTVAIGYPVAVVRRALALRWAGRNAYPAAAMLVGPARRQVHVESEEGLVASGGYTGVVINNTRHSGNFLGFPRADFADGWLDAAILSCGRFQQMLSNVSWYFGSTLLRPWREARVTALRLSMEEPVTVLIDGELVESVVMLSARCVPAAILCQSPRRQ